jgi:hypothetical protein
MGIPRRWIWHLFRHLGWLAPLRATLDPWVLCLVLLLLGLGSVLLGPVVRPVLRLQRAALLGSPELLWRRLGRVSAHAVGVPGRPLGEPVGLRLVRRLVLGWLPGRLPVRPLPLVGLRPLLGRAGTHGLRLRWQARRDRRAPLPARLRRPHLQGGSAHVGRVDGQASAFDDGVADHPPDPGSGRDSEALDGSRHSARLSHTGRGVRG